MVIQRTMVRIGGGDSAQVGVAIQRGQNHVSRGLPTGVSAAQAECDGEAEIWNATWVMGTGGLDGYRIIPPGTSSIRAWG